MSVLFKSWLPHISSPLSNVPERQRVVDPSTCVPVPNVGAADGVPVSWNGAGPGPAVVSRLSNESFHGRYRSVSFSLCHAAFRK